MSVDTSHFSIEFFPPRTPAGEEKLDAVHEKLAALGPEFFSVTYGAGGSTRDGTKRAVTRFAAAGSRVAPHLSFGGSDEEEILALLKDYQAAGIDRLVCLRGDAPSGMGSASLYRYANELVEFVREHTGDHFTIDVACYPEVHPQSRSVESDIEYFKAKVDAGANAAITQYFYNADAYFGFVDDCARAGIDVPIVPGIMPITNYGNLARFSVACGAEIPRWLTKRLEFLEHDDAALRDFGIEVVTDLCEQLLAGGAPGLHFYSMNQADSVTRLWKNLSED